MEYLIALFAQALPGSIPGIVTAFFYRKSKKSAIFYGVIGSAFLPALSLFSGITSRVDVLLASVLYGILFGWGWSLTKRNGGQRIAGSEAGRGTTRATPESDTGNPGLVAIGAYDKSIAPTLSLGRTQETNIIKNSGTSNPHNDDRSQWDIIKEHDARVLDALTRIRPLGTVCMELFKSRVLAIEPNERDIDAIAEEVISEFEKSFLISDVEAINSAYKNVTVEFGEFGARLFKKIYEAVGNHMDIDKVVDEIEEEYHSK